MVLRVRCKVRAATHGLKAALLATGPQFQPVDFAWITHDALHDHFDLLGRQVLSKNNCSEQCQRRIWNQPLPSVV